MGIETTRGDVEALLDRLLPPTLDDAGLNAAFDPFAKAMVEFTHREYAVALDHLVRRLGELGNAQPSPGLDHSALIDLYCAFAVIEYSRHASLWRIAEHLQLWIHERPGKALRGLVAMMGAARDPVLRRIVDGAKDPNGVGLIDESERGLALVCDGMRPGSLDVKLSAVIEALGEQQPTRARPRATIELERIVLEELRERRRARPLFSPPFKDVLQARWATEEAERELHLYAKPNPARAKDLLWSIESWWTHSEAHRRVVGKQHHGKYDVFFGELLNTARSIGGGYPYEVRWRAWVLPSLYEGRFWHDLAGLGGEAGVAYEQTQAAALDAAYRRGALITGAIYVAAIVAPLVLLIAIRTPGTIAAVIRWVSGRLVLSAQYAVSVVRVFGPIGGVSFVARDAYQFYLTHAVKVNETIVVGTEFVLDLVGSESGAGPGSSSSDLLVSASDDAKLIAKHGLRSLEKDIDLIEFVAHTPDGKATRVVGRPSSGYGSRIRIHVLDAKAQVADFGKPQVRFFAEPADALRGAENVGAFARATRESVGHHSLGGLLTTPMMTKIHGLAMKSWHLHALVGTGTDQFKRNSLAIIKATPSGGNVHGLDGALVDGRFASGGSQADWAKDARFLEAAHARTGSDKGDDVIVLMSTHYNRGQAASIEHPSNPGAVILDEVFVVDDIAIHKPTLRDLVAQGHVKQSVLDEAKTIDLQTLEFTPTWLRDQRLDYEAARRTMIAADRERAIAKLPPLGGDFFVAPKQIVIRGQRADSWHAHVLIGTSRDQMRDAALRILLTDPQGKPPRRHPLAPLLVNSKLLTGGNEVLWAENPRYMEAGHVLSRKEGGRDMLVLMSAHHNRRFGGDLEQARTPNVMALDDVYDVEGIAIHKQTLQDLVDAKVILPEVLRDAKKIDLGGVKFRDPADAGTPFGSRATNR